MSKAALALFIFLLVSVGAARAQDSAGAEAVVRDFAGRMADGDFDGALALFRFRAQAERLNHAEWLEAMMAVSPQGPLPVSRHPAYSTLNAAFIAEFVLAQFRGMLYSLLLPEKYLKTQMGRYNFPDATSREDVEREVAEIGGALAPERLRSLKLLRLDCISPSGALLEKSARTYGGEKARRGYDESAEFLLLYEFGGNRYRGAATAYRYGSEWCMGSLSSLQASREKDSGRGNLVPTSEEEYAAFAGKFAAVPQAFVPQAADLPASAPQAAPAAAFATPMEAAEAFCARLGEGDFDSALSLLGVETGEEPNFAALAAATGGFDFGRHIPAPGYSALNRESLRNGARKSIRFFVCALLLKGSLAPLNQMLPIGFYFNGPDAREQVKAKLGEFNDALDPARLKNLRPVRLDRLNPEGFDAAEARRQGASGKLLDYAEFLVLYELDGVHYAGSATMCRFDEGWRMMGPFSLLAMERFNASERFKNAKTILPETTPEEYSALLDM